MKHISTLTSATLKQTAAHGGCGECQTSCQSACKTLLHRGKPEVRARKVITLKKEYASAPAGAPCSCISEENK